VYPYLTYLFNGFCRIRYKGELHAMTSSNCVLRKVLHRDGHALPSDAD